VTRRSAFGISVKIAPEIQAIATKENTMQARMQNPAIVVPDAMQALMALGAATKKGAVPSKTLGLMHLRASQINGCSVCLDMHARMSRNEGETDERLFAVAAWRDAPYFTDAERAALALTEAATRLSDRADPVPDEVWNEAARHYDEQALAVLVLDIALINVWNRLNTTTKQVAGDWMKSAEAKKWLPEALQKAS
jgi:AhpD family alkylhydroperoxidase